MTEMIRNLWPDDVVETEVLTPLAIMKYQAGILKEKTNGLLCAEVRTDDESERVTHTFEIVASALENYRYKLFVVFHAMDMVYPASVIAECLHIPGEGWPQASTQDELLNLIFEVLNSNDAKSVRNSLLAHVNEKIKG
jgi:hypothetical protein